MMSEEYKKLPNAKRQKYEKAAAEDKARYQKEMEEAGLSKPAKTGPKKPMSAYMLFSQDIRASILKKQPNIKNTEIMQKQAKMWKELNEKEKAKWTAAASKDKERYEAEVKGQASGKAKSADKKKGKAKEASEEDENAEDATQQEGDDDAAENQDEEGEAEQEEEE